MTNCEPSCRVERLEDLEDEEYHEEYNGKSLFGVILECTDEGWVNVTWDNGNNEIYLMGNDSIYDLYMAKDVGKRLQMRKFGKYVQSF